MSQRVITFHYKLTGPSGKVIDQSIGREPLSYMEGAGQIIPGLEKELAALKQGDKQTIQVAAADAYGLRSEMKQVTVKREQLPTQEVKVGDRFSGGPDAHSPVFVVTKLSETEVTLDGNHPLAGMDLIFEVEMMDVREATEDEMSHGHAHGAGGHSH